MTIAVPPSRVRIAALPNLDRGRSTREAAWVTSLVAMLVMFGLVMVISSSSLVALKESDSTWYYAQRQALWTVLGIGGLLAAASIERSFWRRAAVPLLGFVLFLLGVVLLVGKTVMGGKRWIGVGPLTIQPAELTKLAMILFVADFLARRCREMGNTRRTLWPIVGILGVVLGLVMLQPNLGTNLIIASIIISMLFSSGVRMRPLVIMGTMAAAGATAVVLATPFRRARLKALFDPWAYRKTSGYQAVQAMVGFADGGLIGVGLGKSKAKWGYLPLVHSDFVFAIIGEELGLVGSLITVGLFVAMAYFGMKIAHGAADRFSALVATGITTWLTSQAFLNIAVVVGLVPNTGVPLPFVSYGGSSLVVTMVAAGILVNIARHPETGAEAGL